MEIEKLCGSKTQRSGAKHAWYEYTDVPVTVLVPKTQRNHKRRIGGTRPRSCGAVITLAAKDSSITSLQLVRNEVVKSFHSRSTSASATGVPRCYSRRQTVSDNSMGREGSDAKRHTNGTRKGHGRDTTRKGHKRGTKETRKGHERGMKGARKGQKRVTKGTRKGHERGTKGDTKRARNRRRRDT